MTVTASNYARAANDLYQTEPWATEVLLRHYEHASGEGEVYIAEKMLDAIRNRRNRKGA